MMVRKFTAEEIAEGLIEMGPNMEALKLIAESPDTEPEKAAKMRRMIKEYETLIEEVSSTLPKH